MIRELPWPVLAAIGSCVLAMLLLGYAALPSRAQRLPLHRRRPGVPAADGTLTGATAATTSLIDQAIGQGRRRGRGVAALDGAGIRMRLQDFVLLTIAAALVAAAAGVVLFGLLAGLLLGVLVPVLTRVLIAVLTGRRRRAFAEQLDDSLQLMASSLRAGHSLLQALASVAREAEDPTAEEFTRILNETRVGRDLNSSLAETARRMGSLDFTWICEAIAINREVGGNLAEVLERIGHTIRERNQIRRQVKALSAEGRLSAIVLMVLPVGIAGFLMFANPGYISGLTEGLLGWGLIVASVLLLCVGGLWLRKAVQVRF